VQDASSAQSASARQQPATGVPVHTPARQPSAAVHASPSSHAALLGFAGFEQTPVDGSQEPAS
jgi:hypothetical protein